MKRLANSTFTPDQTFQQVLLDLYSKSGEGQVLNPGVYADSARNLPLIDRPAYSFVGESVPDRFYQSIDSNMIKTGLLPRFIIVEYLGGRPESNHSSALAIPSPQVIQGLTTLCQQVYPLLVSNSSIAVQYTSTAWQRDLTLEKRIDGLINNCLDEGLSELWNRTHLKIRRLAALIAVGMNPYAPVIDDKCWGWAENFVMASTEKLIYRFQSGRIGAENSETNRIKAITLLIREYLSFSRHEAHMRNVKYEMIQKRIITKRFILHQLGMSPIFASDFRDPSAALKATIGVMIETGHLVEVPKNQLIREHGTGQVSYFIPFDWE
jgi:hypothetical protein